MLAGPDGSGFARELVATGLITPTSFAFTPSGQQIFVAEKAGKVQVVEDGQVVSTFIDISDEVESQGDRGLIGLALDPEFDQNGYVYLNYTVKLTDPQCNPPAGIISCGQLLRVAASGSNPLVADPATREVILDGHVMSDTTHSVGDVDFDTAGNLIFTWGDGGFDNALRLASQDENSVQGKIFRIDPDTGFGIVGNPFFDPAAPDSVASKVWAVGIRNSWRISVDRPTGDVYLGEVTDGGPEEINVIRSDGSTLLNFGWPYFEGDNPSNHNPIAPPGFQYESPLVTYPHLNLPQGDAITGGILYRGGTYPVDYDGRYFFGNLRQNVLYTADQLGNYQQFGNLDDYSSPAKFQQGPDGQIYLLSFSGLLQRLVYVGGGGNAPPVALASASPTAGFGPLTVSFDATQSSDPTNDPLTYSWDFDANGTADATGATPVHEFNAIGRNTVLLTVSDDQGGSAQATIEIDVLASSSTAVANYRNNFSGATFPLGWQYLRNGDNQPIGDPANYISLEWSGTRWESNGDAAFPDANQGNYLHLDPAGGHPGSGVGNESGATVDHYAVAAYTVPSDGFYSVADSFVTNTNQNDGNGGEVRIYVNSDLRLAKTCPNNASVGFDAALGSLTTGDTIYVAIGPNGDDGGDAFAMDFTIGLTDPPGANTNVAVGKPTIQTGTVAGALASRAVDGNTDGNLLNGSVTLTEQDPQPYWEVDLEAIYDISSIKLFNRTDGSGGDHLKDYWVIANDLPLSSGNLNAVLSDPGVLAVFSSGIAGPLESIDMNRPLRYVRVQLEGTNDVLSLAEVQVLTDTGGLPTVTLAATDSSASEGGIDPGQFTVARDTSVGALTVNYAVGGSASSSDYFETLTGSVTIPDGSTSMTLDLTPVDDELPEGNEMLRLTLTTDPAYTIGSPNHGMVTIVENDIASGSVANYAVDFQGDTFPPGWQYLRNSDNQPLGDPIHYVPLEWSGSRWESNGDAAFPDANQGAYLNLTREGGHPGRGTTNGTGATVDHYAIAAYSVSQGGLYAISNSFVTNTDAAPNNGGEVRVYVNSDLILAKTYPGNGGTDFDGALGQLMAGDTVYVAIGPNGEDASDGFSLDFSIDLTATSSGSAVVDRHIFYNQSAFDGNDPAPNADDDGAIAPDKEALLPGQTATFANYTSYIFGINGIMIDVLNLPNDGADLTLADFDFKWGNDDAPGDWTDGPDATQIAARPHPTAAGVTRVTLIWPNNALSKGSNCWVQVTMLANDQTGLMAPDVHYWGNAFGETGNVPGGTSVDSGDLSGVTNHFTNFLNPALIDNSFDFNRDKIVDVGDRTIAVNSQTAFFNELSLISPPLPPPAPLFAGATRNLAAASIDDEADLLARIVHEAVVGSRRKRTRQLAIGADAQFDASG